MRRDSTETACLYVGYWKPYEVLQRMVLARNRQASSSFSTVPGTVVSKSDQTNQVQKYCTYQF
jgi:hypothetical protein